MFIAVVLVGMVIGMITGGTALVAGQPLWMAFALYSSVGFTSALGMIAAVYLCAVFRGYWAGERSIAEPLAEL